jgi:hypothetical protein
MKSSKYKLKAPLRIKLTDDLICSCRRIDNKMNIFKGIKNNKFFMLIFTISVCGQVFIVEYGGTAFQTVPLNKHLWTMSVIIGLVSIPIGAVIRLIPDELLVFSLSKNNNRKPYLQDRQDKEIELNHIINYK